MEEKIEIGFNALRACFNPASRAVSRSLRDLFQRCTRSGMEHAGGVATRRSRWNYWNCAALVFLFLCAAHAYAAVGDRIPICQSPAAGAFLDTQTSSGVQRSVVRVRFEFDIEVQEYDGSTEWVKETFTGPGEIDFGPLGRFATSTLRVRFKNIHGSLAKQICYWYVETK